MAPRPTQQMFSLDYPQSLGTYDEYAAAQKAVDYLSDNEFPVQNCLIVGTDLKQIERVTGRLTYGRVAAAGAASGAWLGLFVGILFATFSTKNSGTATILSTVLIGIAFGLVWALLGYAATRGQRDFSSVKQVVATKYEVLVEHKFLAKAQELLAKMPGRDPFAG